MGEYRSTFLYFIARRGAAFRMYSSAFLMAHVHFDFIHRANSSSSEEILARASSAGDSYISRSLKYSASRAGRSSGAPVGSDMPN